MRLRTTPPASRPARIAADARRSPLCCSASRPRPRLRPRAARADRLELVGRVDEPLGAPRCGRLGVHRVRRDELTLADVGEILEAADDRRRITESDDLVQQPRLGPAVARRASELRRIMERRRAAGRSPRATRAQPRPSSCSARAKPKGGSCAASPRPRPRWLRRRHTQPPPRARTARGDEARRARCRARSGAASPSHRQAVST